MIASGHRLEDIRGYTLEQVNGFMAAIERRQKQERIGQALAMRMAQSTGDGFKNYIKQLSE